MHRVKDEDREGAIRRALKRGANLISAPIDPELWNNGVGTCVHLKHACGTNGERHLMEILEKDVNDAGKYLGLHRSGKHLQVFGDALMGSKAFSLLITYLLKLFDLTLVDCWVNLYRNGHDCKSWHHDNFHDRTPRPNVTIGVSFGESRDLGFQHCTSKKEYRVHQEHGDVFAFDEPFNRTFKHSVPPAPRGQAMGKRMAVIVWANESESVPRLLRVRNPGMRDVVPLEVDWHLWDTQGLGELSWGARGERSEAETSFSEQVHAIFPLKSKVMPSLSQVTSRSTTYCNAIEHWQTSLDSSKGELALDVVPTITCEKPSERIHKDVEVIVVEDFEVDFQGLIVMKKDQRGKVLKIDNDGDAKIDFYDEGIHIIRQRDFDQLRPCTESELLASSMAAEISPSTAERELACHDLDPDLILQRCLAQEYLHKELELERCLGYEIPKVLDLQEMQALFIRLARRKAFSKLLTCDDRSNSNDHAACRHVEKENVEEQTCLDVEKPFSPIVSMSSTSEDSAVWEVEKALTLQGAQQALAILSGYKLIENRSWKIPRGWYALHCGSQMISDDRAERVRQAWPSAPPEESLPHGVIMGLFYISMRVTPEECRPGYVWARGPLCHLVSKAVEFPQPIRCRGGKGLWDLEQWQLSKIRAQLKAASICEFNLAAAVEEENL